MYPATESLPKALIEVAGQPFAFWQLEAIAARGVRRVVYCVGHMGGMIRDTVGDGGRFGLSVEYSFDGPVLLGTGGAVRLALPLLGGDFFVTYGDSFLCCDWAAVQEAYDRSRMPALMTAYRNEGLWEKSNVFLFGGKAFYDKKNPHPKAAHIDPGLGVYSASAFLSAPQGVPFDLSDLCRDLSVANLLAGCEILDRYYEIGSPEGLAEAEAFLRKQPGCSSGG